MHRLLHQIQCAARGGLLAIVSDSDFSGPWGSGLGCRVRDLREVGEAGGFLADGDIKEHAVDDAGDEAADALGAGQRGHDLSE